MTTIEIPNHADVLYMILSVLERLCGRGPSRIALTCEDEALWNASFVKKVFETAGRCGVGDLMEALAIELIWLICGRSGPESVEGPDFRSILPLVATNVDRHVRNMM